jgi:hypothetical protein
LSDEMVRVAQDMGFELWSIWPAFVDPRNGRALQVDVIFFRRRPG